MHLKQLSKVDKKIYLFEYFIFYLDSTSNHSRTNSNDSLHSFIFEPTEIDYLKQIILAYMTGTDRMVLLKKINKIK